MKSTIYFIVQVEDSYNNYIELGDGTKLSTNNSIDSVEHINRVGKVIDAPKGTIVDRGDFLLFHHNICRESWGAKGKKRTSVFAMSDNTFFVPVTEIFMYMKAGSDKWNALAPFVFIKPIPAGSEVLPNGLEVKEDDYNGKKPLVGIMSYPNKELMDKGVREGDIVAFLEDSEHEYEIKGNLYYKMRNSDILAIL
jgi:co-chaperonin GroES (HSP10)